MISTSDKDLHIDFHEDLLSGHLCDKISRYFELLFEKNGLCRSRRTNQTYGLQGLTYDVRFRENIVHRRAIDWNNFKVILALKSIVERITEEEFNICVVQRYPNGNVGINPHRDKEMIEGTKIAGFSFGQTRTLAISRGNRTYEYDLTPGSLYVLNPPTNEYWTHSILKDDSQDVRFSLTFRNYRV